MKDIEESLPLYVNRRLSEEERVAVAQALSDDAGLAEEAKFLSGLRVSLQAEPVDTPGELGLARLKRSLAQERQVQVANAPIQAGARSFWRPLALTACAILGLQAGFLAMQYSPIGDSPVTTLGETRVISGPLVQRVFHDEFTVAQIHALLSEIEGNLIGGPGALGVFEIELPADSDVDALLNKLERHPGVEQVSRP